MLAGTVSMTSPSAAAAGTITIGGDLTVNRMAFGAMRITGPRILGEPKNAEEAGRVLRRAVDLGVTLIDTADSYGPNVSERLIGETLSPYPEGLVIATKGGLTRRRTGSWPNDARPEHLRKACEGSLSRLRLDRIDLYQLHAPDPKVPFADSVGALAELRTEGKIRHVGLSNVSLAQLREAQAIVPIASVQNYFHVARREAEEVLDACGAGGIAYLPWRPLDGGALSGSRRNPLVPIAETRGATPGQIALAWLLARSPVMVPIPGTGSVAHLEENVGAAAIRLTDDEFAAIAGATDRGTNG
jgi:aryl-alcohol dehydrogenase-like predicted oxidoreductase